MKKNFSVFIIVFVFIVAANNPAYAYIDPGTGSMIFSVVLGAVTTLIFVFNSLFLKIKMKMFSGHSSKKIKNENIVIYSEGKQYYPVFKPVLDEFEKRQIPVSFFTSDQSDPFFNEKYDYVKGEFIGKGNKAYFKLAVLNCDVCLMTTPQLDVLQLKRSKYVKHYCHIFHSITSSMDYRLFALDYYDSVLCDADFQIPLIRELEAKRNLKQKELIVTGSTYMDYYFEKLKDCPAKSDNSYTILIAPTWGKDGLLTKYGSEIIDKLKDFDYKIIIRPHPQSMIVEKKLIDKLREKFKDCKNISWNYDRDNLNVLSISDIMVSDFSSVMFDYAFLFNRPFLYFNTIDNNEIYDMSDLDEIPYRYKIMSKIGRRIVPEDIENIPNIIKDICNIGNYEEELKMAKHTSWMYQGEGAKRVVDFLVSKQKEISSKQ